MMNLQAQLVNEIELYGQSQIVSGKNTKELINYSFSVHDFDYILTDEQRKYVSDKLSDYLDSIMLAINRLKNDINSRQAVIQFDANADMPNCLISIQLLIRNNKLFVIVYSRSLDVTNKLYVDIEIVKRISDMIEKEFSIKLYSMYFHTGSLHVYV